MKTTLYCFAIIVFSFGCVTNKARYTSKSIHNGNNAIISINGATLKRGKSVLGIATQVISTGVGGYLGYKYLPLAVGYKDDAPNVNAYGGAAVGALAGYGVNNSVNFLLGDRKTEMVGANNYDKWERKFDPRNRLIKISNGKSDLVFVKKMDEKNFTIKNYDDAFYFSKAFPESKYTTEKVNQAIQNLSWNQYLNLASLFQKREYTSQIMDSYFEKSNTASNLIEAIKRFPTFKSEAEPFLFKLVESKNDILYFLNTYPNSGFKDQIYTKIFSTKNIINSFSKEDLKNTFDRFSDFKAKAEEPLFNSLSSKNDIQFFYSNYPNSPFKSNLLQKIVSENNIFSEYSKSELSQLIIIFEIENEEIIDKIINRKIILSNSFSEIDDNIKLYPEKINLIEERAIDFVKDISSFNTFYYLFPNGKYVHAYSDGIITSYEGKYIGKYWDTENSRPQNYQFGIFKSEDEEYIGQYENGEKYGQGIYKGNLVNRGYEIYYEGEFRNGKMNGKGHYVEKSKDLAIDYTGDFKNNWMDGKGTAIGNLGEGYVVWFDAGQSSYSGTWKEGKADGEGKYIYGELWYEGGFRGGAVHGTGTLRLPNGIRITGPWKDHAPNGNMHFYKYILMGLIRDDYYQEAYSMKDLGMAEKNFISDMSKSRTESNERTKLPEEKREREIETERQRSNEKIAKNNEQRQKEELLRRMESEKKKQDVENERIKDCIADVSNALSEVRLVDSGSWTKLECPCKYYHSSEYSFDIKVNRKNEWFYVTKGIFEFPEGPFESKLSAISGVCENRYKSKK